MKNMKKILLSTILISISLLSFSQKETNIWYFGDYCGLEFTDTSQIILNNSAMFTNGGSNSTICDKYGNLLFYTDGITVFNSQHDTMPNGTNLPGSLYVPYCIIIPHPRNNNLYYILSTTNNNTSPTYSVFFSLIDMRLDNGLGDVIIVGNENQISDNYFFFSVVRHCNKRDYWLLISTLSNKINTYLISEKGIKLEPIVNNNMSFGPTGANFTNSDSIFYATGLGYNWIKYFFNTHNGNIQILQSDTIQNIGQSNVCLSPNNTKLYVAKDYGIYQFDFDVPFDSINSSSIFFYVYEYYSVMQKAINGKIYLPASNSSGTFCTINSPNNLGLYSNVVANAFEIPYNSYQVSRHLPRFIAGLKYANSFIWNNSCIGDTTQFEYLMPDCNTVTFIEWTFYDQYSGNIVSNEYNPVHYYAEAGKYDIRLITSYGTSMDTIFKTIEIFNPTLNLGTDINATLGDTIGISPDISCLSFNWSTGENTDSIFVTNSGLYAITVTDNQYCTVSDSINIHFTSSINTNEVSIISIFPNPASASITVTSAEAISKIEIYNQTGQLVKTIHELSLPENSYNIDISDLPVGSYFVRVISSSSPKTRQENSWVEKFVVVR